MFEEIQVFAGMMFQGFARLLPYVLLTIPIAVAVQMSGAAKHIRKAFAARPVPAIILATIVGAFSPFCSCGVIPLVASLLIGGVPLAPVMSFWVASPSMDPEIFFLSVATLGWNLALWRLLSTLVLSLSAGFITHMAVRKGWISGPILRSLTVDPRQSLIATVRTGYRWLRGAIWRPAPVLATEFCCGGHPQEDSGEGNRFTTNRVFASATQSPGACSSAGSCEAGAESSPWPPAPSGAPPSFGHRLLREGGSAALLVGKFMLLALVLETLFSLYVPREWVVAVVGQSSRLAILTAAVVGVPLYTGNLTALPMIGALLGQGMNPSAALAFLIAGPTTTIPAMAAVWGLVHRRVFALYVAFALIGAVLAGILHRIATVL
jgi:uncharacterized membrane protein YraQ (UPF0718 family)